MRSAADQPSEPGVRFTVRNQLGETVIVAVAGHLTREGRPGLLRSAIAGFLVDNRVRRIRLDLSGATAIDLQGVGALLALRSDSDRHGKVLAIDDPSPPVRSRLEETGTLVYLGGSVGGA
jgi:anti-anti-sigma regulatory factor